MKMINISNAEISTLESYWSRLKNLSVGAKLELISRLSSSLLSTTEDVSNTKKGWASRFAGCWKDERTADEIVDDLRSARTSNRDIEL